MQSLVDLYRINRCEILSPLMEAAKRPLTLVWNLNCDILWTMQRGGEVKVQNKRLIREDTYMQKQERIQITDVTLALQGTQIPHRMLERYARLEDISILEAMERAGRRQQFKVQKLRAMGLQQAELYSEVGLRQSAIHVLERDLKGRIIAEVTAPEILSWQRPCKLEEAIEELNLRSTDLVVFLTRSSRLRQRCRHLCSGNVCR